LSVLENAAFDAEEQLADAADLVAQLTAVDGALVLTSDLRVLGFGAEIVLDTAVPITAYEVVGSADRVEAWPEVDSQSFGMRHRSALRCVSVSNGVAAFVISQDSSVCFIWKKGRKVLLKKNVNTANPNMVGA
jgi:DNA integrity scanning protein DisA with diadenylate cyclase activity